MAEKKVGVLVKEARAAAGLTQEKLAKAAGEGLTAADISKCEQGKADLTTAQLKKIAVACGVTQTSLVNAPKNLKTTAAKTSAAKTSSAAKTTSSKTSAAKTSASSKTSTAKASTAKTSSAKTMTAKTSGTKTSSAKKTTAPAGANTSIKVTATEQKLIEAYREASSDLKKAAMKVLKGEYGETVTTLLSASSGSSATAADGVGEIIGNLLGGLLTGGK